MCGGGGNGGGGGGGGGGGAKAAAHQEKICVYLLKSPIFSNHHLVHPQSPERQIQKRLCFCPNFSI